MCGCGGKPSTTWRRNGIASDDGQAGRLRPPEGIAHFAAEETNLAIPDIQSIMLPLLKLAGDTASEFPRTSLIGEVATLESGSIAGRRSSKPVRMHL